MDALERYDAALRHADEHPDEHPDFFDARQPPADFSLELDDAECTYRVDAGNIIAEFDFDARATVLRQLIADGEPCLRFWHGDTEARGSYGNYR